MAEIVFPCSCGMLLKVHGDDQIGQGIVCPSCGGTAIVPAVGVAADWEGPPLSYDPPPQPAPAASHGGKWFGLAYLAGASVVTLGLIKFVLMPAIATPPVVVAQADSPNDDQSEAEEAPRRLLTRPHDRTTEDDTTPAAPTPKASARPKPAPRSRVPKSAGSGGPPRKTPRKTRGGMGGVPGPGPGRPPAAPRGRPTTPDATPKTDDHPVPSTPSPRPDTIASEGDGPAKARRVPKEGMRTKTADNSAAKKSEKGQDPAARVRTLMNLAFNLEVQQNYDGALEYYREVATKYPDAPQAKKAADRIRALTAK